MNVVVLIPSLNPDESLLQVVRSIREQGFERFVIVDDGSKPACRGVFNALEADGCAVVRHAVNLGKGRALKTGFNHILQHMADAQGVVTCDADGQHHPQDIAAVARALGEHGDKVILGARQFFAAKVPLPNLLGNTITRFVFWLLTGLRYGDTQSGLRAFPMTALPAMMAVAGERFEYENVMLLAFRENALDYAELPIRAVYAAEGKQAPHFNRAVDSVRIYKKLLGFAAAPIFGAFFSLMLFMVLSLAWGTVPANLALAAVASVAGWLTIWLAAPARRGVQAVAVTLVSVAALCALYLLFTVALALPPIGAYLLAGLLSAPLGYSLWLGSRCPRKPTRTKL